MPVAEEAAEVTRLASSSAADLVLMLKAAQRQGRYRKAMNRVINAYRL
jgi:hypothetical protein